MTTYPFILDAAHPSWHHAIKKGLSMMDKQYLQELSHCPDWLPGPAKIFNAFSLPIDQVQYVLFGESPYPRQQSANGFAFWDNAVNELWSPTGLSKKVNRATSLRNILKMLLIAEGKLSQDDTSQEAIAKIDKSHLIQTNQEFFQHLLQQGILLLNATLVLQQKCKPQKDAKAWAIFMQTILDHLLEKHPNTSFILFGNIAAAVDKLLIHHQNASKIISEHPYNLSFVTNPHIIEFFRPMHLLRKN